MERPAPGRFLRPANADWRLPLACQPCHSLVTLILSPPQRTPAKDPAIFVAPAGSGNTPWDFTRDSVVFDDLLALVDANLCIDDSRVFSTGFSFGAMMTYRSEERRVG